MKWKEDTKWSQIPLESVGNMAFMAPSTLVAEVLAEGTCSGFEFQASSHRTDGAALKHLYRWHSILGAVHKDIQGPASLCPSAAINSVTEEAECSPAVVGSKGRFVSPVACAVSPKLGGSANLASWRNFLEYRAVVWSMLLVSPLPFCQVAAEGACLDGIYLTPSKNPSCLSKWLPY